MVEVLFGLPLKTDHIAQYLGKDSDKGIFEVWSLELGDYASWDRNQRSCGEVKDLCFVSREIARSEMYVFGTGHHFARSGWDPCALEEDAKMEPYFAMSTATR